jgi:CheY-like chemotaxis protein
LNNKKLNIFLADDDDDDREFFNIALKKLGSDYELTMLNNGQKVMQYFSTLSVPPDYVFLDINMPLADGIECLHHIKSLHPQHTFPIIMLSTALSEDMINKCHAAGASIYIRKPSKFTELVEILKYCIHEFRHADTGSDFVLSRA